MLLNFDKYKNETISDNDYLDVTAMLTQVVGYCGDLNGRSETSPLTWQGGAPISSSDRRSA